MLPTTAAREAYRIPFRLFMAQPSFYRRKYRNPPAGLYTFQPRNSYTLAIPVIPPVMATLARVQYTIRKRYSNIKRTKDLDGIAG